MLDVEEAHRQVETMMNSNKTAKPAGFSELANKMPNGFALVAISATKVKVVNEGGVIYHEGSMCDIQWWFDNDFYRQASQRQ